MTSNETPSIGNPGNSVSEVQVLSRAPFLRATCLSLFASPLPKGEDARRAGEVSSAAPNGDFFDASAAGFRSGGDLFRRGYKRPASRSEERRVGKECRSRWS